MSNKYQCPNSGITYEGEQLADQLGLIPTAEERFEAEFAKKLSEQRIPVDPTRPLNYGTVEKDGVRFQVTPAEHPAPAGGVMSHFTPRDPDYVGRNGMLTFMNKTVDEVLGRAQGQMREHKWKAEADSQGKRFDPVTKTYY